MSPKFRWTRQREQAAQLVADDRLSNDEIAAKVGVSAKQLERWKEHPGFMRRVEEHVTLWRERIRRHGLAVKERRIESLITDFNATEVILIERGKQLNAAVEVIQESYAGGARTGFITRDFKGKDADTPVVPHCRNRINSKCFYTTPATQLYAGLLSNAIFCDGK